MMEGFSKGGWWWLKWNDSQINREMWKYIFSRRESPFISGHFVHGPSSSSPPTPSIVLLSCHDDSWHIKSAEMGSKWDLSCLTRFPSFNPFIFAHRIEPNESAALTTGFNSGMHTQRKRLRSKAMVGLWAQSITCGWVGVCVCGKETADHFGLIVCNNSCA